MIGFTGLQILWTCITAELQNISFDYRQKDVLLPIPFLYKIMRLYFITQ